MVATSVGHSKIQTIVLWYTDACVSQASAHFVFRLCGVVTVKQMLRAEQQTCEYFTVSQLSFTLLNLKTVVFQDMTLVNAGVHKFRVHVVVKVKYFTVATNIYGFSLGTACHPYGAQIWRKHLDI